MSPSGRLGQVLLLCAALITAAPAFAAAPPAPALQPRRAIVRGHFTQKKILAELDHPLISTGHFVAAAGRGLIWQVQQPIKTQLVITPGQLVARSQGHETLRVNADQQPGLQVIAAVLLAVFQANTQRLRQFFTVQTKRGPAGRWTMTLRPKTQTVDAFIKQVTLAGAAEIKRITIAEPNGDRDVIALHIDAKGPRKLTPKERAALAIEEAH
jgi:hypothetical protein